jgi:hypothetical protein
MDANAIAVAADQPTRSTAAVPIAVPMLPPTK